MQASKLSEQELSEHMKVKHTKKYFKCDQCDSVFENEEGLNCHRGKKHKLTSSPNPQVDGQMEEVEEEPPSNPQSKNSYSCKNFKFKCEGHKTLKDHIKGCQEAQAQTKKASS